MRGAVPLLRLHTFMTWTEKTFFVVFVEEIAIWTVMKLHVP
jgi:hypothetical protein